MASHGLGLMVDVWKSIHVLTPDVQVIGRGGRKVGGARQVYKCGQPARGQVSADEAGELMSFAEENGLTLSTLSSVKTVESHQQSRGPTAERTALKPSSSRWTVRARPARYGLLLITASHTVRSTRRLSSPSHRFFRAYHTQQSFGQVQPTSSLKRPSFPFAQVSRGGADPMDNHQR